VTTPKLTADAHRILWAQALRAFAYGFGAVLLGSTLDREGFSSGEVGFVLAAVVAGTVLSSLAVGGATGSAAGGRTSCSTWPSL
jgi:hypothetical protein